MDMVVILALALVALAAALDDLKQWTNDKPARRKA